MTPEPTFRSSLMQAQPTQHRHCFLDSGSALHLGEEAQAKNGTQDRPDGAEGRIRVAEQVPGS